MSTARCTGLALGFAALFAACVVSLGGNVAVQPRVRVANEGVVLDARPSVSGGTATTDVHFGLSRVREFRTVNVDLGGGRSVPIQLPLASIYEVHTTVAMPLTQASIGADVHAGWIPLSGVGRAENLANTHGRPMLFMERSGSAGYKEKRLTASYARHPGFKGFVKVQREKGEEVKTKSPEIGAALEKAEKLFPDDATPRIVCLDTKGRVIGVVTAGADKKALEAKSKEFVALFKSLKMLDKNVAVGDKLTKMGKYKTALKVFAHVAACDPKEKYYPKLLKTKKGEIDTSAKARLDKAEKLLAEGNRIAASRMVEPILEDGGDFDFVDRAKTLKANCRKL